MDGRDPRGKGKAITANWKAEREGVKLRSPARARSRSAMHDFCFTYPYGIAVLLGGILGYLLKGSIPSLVGGVVSGSLLLLSGNRSLTAYHKGYNSYFFLFLETVISVSLTFVMGQRYLSTSKLFPPGIIAAVSGVMSLFYLYKLATGGNHINKKSN